jgi:peptidoglycan/LPS O-acetylase OafA/YrhL
MMPTPSLRHLLMNASRIPSLDALRGLAALGVALYHYGLLAPAGARPFEAVLAPLYEFGQWAVPLFYMLSGYIFFEAYARPLGQGEVSGREFFWRRASRLYPLHIVTLLAVAALQWQALRATGAYFLYTHNDLHHFLLNLVFLQFSWFDPIMSFNGPSWSLSIEAALYAVFFVFARRFGASVGPRLMLGALCLALSTARFALPLAGPLNLFFAEGLGCFFLGGCLQATEGFSDRRRLALGFFVLALGVGLAYLTNGRREVLPILFAGLVLSAVGSAVFRRVAAWPLLTWLGDISYSTYLWHFPITIALVVASARFAPIAFSSAWALALYFALVFVVSTLSYRYFERPAQTQVRRWAMEKSASVAAAAPASG